MALIECKECKNELSEKADKCVKCGCPSPKAEDRRMGKIAGLVCFLVGVLLLFVACLSRL
ncbi:MAG: hypothetical protein FWD44_02960 [Oscillospiraceae bacterium]|nr:hypothetical protein [Oscillospiraceae bacterium]